MSDISGAAANVRPRERLVRQILNQVLSSHLFLVFGSNLAFDPKNKNQMHFSGQGWGKP